ncbi:hypothetical protein [Winogradskyella flava]|uniref:Uncharacterized protein n=1 Tax=Winogradskyella flava TaxID=1884876 RepID=A0A842IRN9_9FLAO|nr:hypothetical protein [Winogradskyella flava]MBC2845700.1 hypothetical protein [Winogradskyella flava]
MKEVNKQLIPIACTLLTILPVIYFAKNNSDTDPNYAYLLNAYLIVIISIVIMLFIAAFFGDLILALFRKQLDNYTNFIYQRYKTAIEYIDVNGKTVSLNTTIYITNLNFFSKKKTTSNELVTDGYGKIEPESGTGINTRLVRKKDFELSYETNISKKNTIKNEHYTTFGAKYLDTFCKEGSNFWQIQPKHYCKFYEFILIYPDSSKEIELNFRIGDRCKDGTCENWRIDSETDYTTYTRFGKKIAKVLFYNISNSEVRYISWNFF